MEGTATHYESEGGGSSRSHHSFSSRKKPSTTYTIADKASVEENGRTYTTYNDGAYCLPNDGVEQDRLDFQHKIWLMLLDGELTQAPIGEPANVLDIGTGTGIWALQFAKKHPNSNVIGTDLSLIQPDLGLKNCQFFREDTEKNEWIFDVDFDYIHLRAMCSCFQDARGMIHKLFEKVKPGGWVEYQDFAFEIVAADEASEKANQEDPISLQKFFDREIRGIQMLGRNIDVTAHYKTWMLEAGFVDVVERQILCPVNPWPIDPKEKRLGQYTQANFHDGAEAGLRFLRPTFSSDEETREYVKEAQKRIADTSVHNYSVWYVVYGRKPAETWPFTGHAGRS